MCLLQNFFNFLKLKKKTPYLIYVVYSLSLNSLPTAWSLIPEWSLCNTRIFSIGLITTFLRNGAMLDSASAQCLGIILNSEITKRSPQI